MREPDLVTIVFGYLPAERLCALLRNSSVWMTDSDENRKQIITASEAEDLESLPGRISCVSHEQSQEIAGWLRKTLDEVDDHHDGHLWTKWKQIDVTGLERTPAIEEVAQDYGDVLANESGLSITSTDIDG